MSVIYCLLQKKRHKVRFREHRKYNYLTGVGWHTSFDMLESICSGFLGLIKLGEQGKPERLDGLKAQIATPLVNYSKMS